MEMTLGERAFSSSSCDNVVTILRGCDTYVQNDLATLDCDKLVGYIVTMQCEREMR